MSISDRDQLDLLMSRIADGEATNQDWQAFSALAEQDPGAWKHLAQAQRDHGALSLAVGVALHGVEHVDLPTRDAAAEFLGRRNAPTHVRTWSRMGMWGGWAAAACVALAWMTDGNFGPPVVGNQASLLPAGYTIKNPDDAVQAYLDMGKKQNTVLGELPQRLLVNSRPAENGRVEVIFVRQFVERAEVSDLMRFAQDESGRPVPVRVAIPAGCKSPD